VSVDLLAAHMREIDIQSALGPSPTKTIYVLIEKGEVVYVGQTVNLAGRIGNHSTNQERSRRRAKVFDRVLALDVPREDAAAYEGALIRRFNPPDCKGSPQDRGNDEDILSRFGLTADLDAAAAFNARRSEPFFKGHAQSRIRSLARRKWNGRIDRVLWRATTKYLKSRAA
jgi:predicted GIY-YIG superfamily endonuclease